MRYRAFISYSHVDTAEVRWLHRALENFRVPLQLRSQLPGNDDRLGPMFRDRDELPSGADLTEAVRLALSESEALIVVCSPAAAASPWVNEEIRCWLELDRPGRIFCYVVDGNPGASDETNCFPPALTAQNLPDGHAPEPVAADARRQGDGRKDALLKLIAGLLGTGFDTLKQRELRRRHRRMAAATALSLVVALVTGVLAFNASVAKEDAEIRRGMAEDLVDFMLGDLQEELGRIGRLDVFDRVGDEAMDYFAAQRDRDDTAHSRAQRARNLRQIGEIRLERGQHDQALEAFAESLLLTRRIAEDPEADAAARIDHANSHFWVGYVHWQRGDLPAAQTSFERSRAIVDAVHAAEPDAVDWIIEVTYAYTNLGRVLELQGNLEGALAAYTRVMESNRQLLKLEPDNPDWVYELGFSHNNVGKLVAALGRLDEAEVLFRSDLAIKQERFAEDREHNIHRGYLGVSQYYLGELLATTNRTEEARVLLEEALAHFRFLTDVDPERLRWRARRGRIERALAGLAAAEGRDLDARALFDDAIRTFDELVALKDDVPEWRRGLLRSLLAAADFHLRAGHPDAALGVLERLGDHVDALATDSNREAREIALHADLCRGELARLRGDVDATSRLRAVLATFDAHFAGSRDPRILLLRARALAGLGRADEADALRADLAAVGYAPFPLPQGGSP